MIDLHSHVLPCMDDGSSSVEMSLKMLRMSYGQGIRIMAATPHFYAQKESPQAFLARRQAALEAIPQDHNTMPRLLPGAEIAYFEGISTCESLETLRIGQSDLVLIEMPFAPWTGRMVEELCRMKARLGVHPVLAHGERYRKFRGFARHLEQLLQAGVLVQCNAEFFLSPICGRKAMGMLSDGAIHFLGSDCHSDGWRAPNLAAALEKIREKLGEASLCRLEELAGHFIPLA